MGLMTLDLPPEIYKRLEEEARKRGKTPEALTRELLEILLRARDESGPGSMRDVLRSAGRLSSLSGSMKCRIVPGVTLEEVRKALEGKPDLSEIISKQRGPKL